MTHHLTKSRYMAVLQCPRRLWLLVHEQPRFVIVMLLERSMAHKIDRQLTHRNAARSVSGMAAMLAHEIKKPDSGSVETRSNNDPGGAILSGRD